MKQRFSDGFTLVELAIVLAVIGVMGALTVPLTIKLNDFSKSKVAVARQETILRSLAAYVLRHHRLPYAADPAAPNETFGMEKQGLSHGIVPYKTLGLESIMGKDGYNFPITYMVAPEFCKKMCGIQRPPLDEVSRPGALSQEDAGSFTPRQAHIPRTLGSISQPGSAQRPYVCDVVGTFYTDKTPRGEEGKYIIVLISHGPGGHGSYLTGIGSTTPMVRQLPQAGPYEKANTRAILNHGTDVYRYPLSRAKFHLFRHTVKAVTRDNLMAVYAHHPCEKLSWNH